MSKLLILRLLLLTSVIVGLTSAVEDVEFVIVVYRHGDRTPIQPYPTDPYRNASNWPVGFGQLTPRGKMMQYNLGKYLRERYGGSLLSSGYSETEITVRSTDVDRTLMSAQSNLAGLYPPVGDQIWNKELMWQPVPVHTVPLTEDNLLSSHADCPRMKAAISEVLASEEIAKIDADYDWVYEYVTEKIGDNVTNMIEVDYIFDTLFIEKLYNKTLPAWTDKEGLYEAMRFLRDTSFKITTWTDELKVLRYDLQGAPKNSVQRLLMLPGGSFEIFIMHGGVKNYHRDSQWDGKIFWRFI